MLGSVWNGYGKVLLDVVKGCSGTTVFPQTQRVRLVRLSLFGCDPTTSISSAGNPRTSHGNTVCESAQTDDCTGNHPRSTPSRCFAQRSSRARGLIRGWIQTAWNGWIQTVLRTGCLSPKKSPKKPINRMCLGEESTDEQSGISTTGQRQMGPPTTPETGC